MSEGKGKSTQEQKKAQTVLKTASDENTENTHTVDRTPPNDPKQTRHGKRAEM